MPASSACLLAALSTVLPPQVSSDFHQSVFSSVQFSCVRLFATPLTAAHQASLSITNSLSLPKVMSIESDAIQPSLLCCPLLLSSIFPSIRVFSNESVLHIRWPKYWHFSISPSNEYSGLISFRMDWLDLLAVQGTLKSFLQCHSSKASILRCSAPSNTPQAVLTGRVYLTRPELSGEQRFSMSCFLLCSSHPAWHLGCRGHPLNVSFMNEQMTDSFRQCPRTSFGYSRGEQED